MSGDRPPLCGAIDLGGTKIEARLFDAALVTLNTRRIPTPTADFDGFIAGLAAQIGWLCEVAGDAALPVGISLAGWVDPVTGNAFASNIPITGRNVAAALRQRFGRDFPILNDCMAFAYSEAHGGAGDGVEVVLGVILGTGMGAGITIGGTFPPRLNGVAVEIGHVGMPGRALAEFGLPLWPCGCGKAGCMEHYVSGTGLAALAEFRLGRRIDAAALAADGTAEVKAVLSEWADLTAECLLTLQLIADPGCIVFGGGVSNIPGMTKMLEHAFERRRLGPIAPPPLRIARFGDSSGARGAALYALREGRS